MKLARLESGEAEIFHTLQGEGLSLGRPAVFVRLAGCNLHCQWCDTPYTWNWEGTPWVHEQERKYDRAREVLEQTPEEVSRAIERAGRGLVVFTGGEPLLQGHELVAVIQALSSEREVEVETNGTRVPPGELDALVSRYHVSPKLAHSGMEASKRLSDSALAFFSQHSRAQFKFVVQGEGDLAEIQELQCRYGWAASRISLMPEGRSAVEILAASQRVAALCLRHGYHLSMRLHVLLWGDERGV